VADSRAIADTFWVHNDRGDTARFFAMGHAGNLLGTFPLAGVTAVDWEDIAINAKPGGGNYLYLGDIGDNDSNRSQIVIYRTDEPTSTASATIPVGGYTAATLLYPNGARNAESLIIDPLTSDIFIVTKGATAQIYSAPASVFDSSTPITMTACGTLGTPLATATAADISPDGLNILVRNRTAAYLYGRAVGQTVADALHGTGIPFALGASPLEPQGEAIGWAAGGASFYTVSEEVGSPIYEFSFSTPPDIRLAGDYNGDDIVDAADYTVWRNALGTRDPLPNQVDTPDQVTMEDYFVWKDNYGNALGEGAGQPGLLTTGALDAVPEPTAIVLLLMGSCIFMAVRRASINR